MWESCECVEMQHKLRSTAWNLLVPVSSPISHSPEVTVHSGRISFTQ
uniref:Uncharacterized protein n=1 Tax=Anguilla anguilla TaxID=7936 RepID=A0A0E9UUB0_ANGAN